MATPILMPMPGQMTETCVLVAWLKHEGDVVHRGDVLFEIETDKANMDVEAFDEGVLLRRLVAEGETVPVNTVCGYVGASGEAIPEAPPAAPPASAEPALDTVPAAETAAEAEAPATARAAAPDATSGSTNGGVAASGRSAISPRAARLAAGASIDPGTVRGTGPGGRITERDVERAIAERSAPATPGERASAPTHAPEAGQASAQPALQANPEPGLEVDEPARPLSPMRRRIAERMTRAVTTIPQFAITAVIDMTRVVELRERLRAEGTLLGVTDFVLAAVARTLAEFPEVNSRTDGSSIWLRRRVHLGVAATVPAGLVVVVARDADRASIGELHGRVARLVASAREGTLPPDDMTGSTFTVSNLGMFGVDQFTAIVSPGEAAVLAVSSVAPTPVAVGDGVAVRQVMKVTLSADHRIVDGELAARFLGALRRRLQDPVSFLGESLNA